MPGGYKARYWSEMTRGEIFGNLVAFTIIGGCIIGAAVYDIIRALPDLGLWEMLSGGGVVFTAAVVVSVYVQAVQELRRRQHDANRK